MSNELRKTIAALHRRKAAVNSYYEKALRCLEAQYALRREKLEKAVQADLKEVDRLILRIQELEKGSAGAKIVRSYSSTPGDTGRKYAACIHSLPMTFTAKDVRKVAAAKFPGDPAFGGDNTAKRLHFYMTRGWLTFAGVEVKEGSRRNIYKRGPALPAVETLQAKAPKRGA